MKRIFLFLAMSVLSSTLSFGQKKYEMVVEKTDGTKSVFNTEDVVRTYFSEREFDDISYLSCPDSNHPHLIDLGLPSGTKWACCNVGASKPEGYGGSYAWGEVNEKSVYNEVTYQYCTGDDTNGDGWYEKNRSYQSLGSDIAGTQYDVAHVRWGGSWVMPSIEQLKELLDNCTSTWITENGVDGRKFTSKINGGIIFLPFPDSYRAFWSSTPSGEYYARDLVINSNGAFDDGYNRYGGHRIRPVVRK